MRPSILRNVIFSTILLFLVFQSSQVFTSSGNPPTSSTGAPNEGTCRGCHGGTSLNGGAFRDSVILESNIPVTGYLPDSTYEITLRFHQPGVNTMGFQLTVLDSATNQFRGDLSESSNRLNTGNSFVNGSSREYIYHTSLGNSASNNRISWTFNWQAPSSSAASGPVYFYYALNASNNNGGSSGDTIYAKSTFIPLNDNLPEAQILVSDTNVCTGDTVVFTASGTKNPNSFEWSFNGANISQSTDSIVKVVFTQSGNQTVSLEVCNNFGCSPTASQAISVNRTPNAGITAVDGNIFCEGDSIRLLSSNANSISWSTGDNSQLIWASDSGLYTVVLRNGQCSDTASTAISFYDNPELNLSTSTDSACTEDSILLTASQGFSNYQFFVEQKLIQNAGNNAFVTDTGLKEVFVKATSNDGCEVFSDTMTLFFESIQSGPAVNCAEVTTSTILFEWQPVQNANLYEYSTDSGASWDTTSLTELLISNLNFDERVQVRVRALTDGLCGITNTSIKSCQTNSCISLTFDSSIDSIVCEGEEANISFSNFSSQEYAISLNGSDFSKMSSYSLEINRDSLMNFLFIDSGELNCPPKPLDISIDFVPKGNTDLVFDKEEICAGDSLSIQADARFLSYEFFKNGLNVQNGTEAIFQDAEPANGDQYYALLEAERSCIFASDTIEAIVNALPNTGFIATISGNEVTFEDTSSGNIQDRVWDLGDGNSAFMANFTHLYTVADTYSVQLTNTDEKGCSGFFIQEIIIEESTGLENLELEEVKVYPNPAISIIYIENLPQELLNIRILNAQGAEMGIYNTGSGQTQIDISQFPKGLYYLTFSLGNEFNSIAFIVQ